MTVTPKTPIKRSRATRAYTPEKEKLRSIGYQSPDNSSREEPKKISPKDAPSTPINWRHKNGENAYASPLPHAPFAAPNAPKKK